MNFRIMQMCCRPIVLFCQRPVMMLEPCYSRVNLIANINVNFTDVRSLSVIARRRYLGSRRLFTLG